MQLICSLDEALERAFCKRTSFWIGPATPSKEVHFQLSAHKLRNALERSVQSEPLSRVRSVMLRNLRLVGDLDLEGAGSAATPLPRLLFHSCEFSGDCRLIDAHWQSLDLARSHFADHHRWARGSALHAQRVKIEEELSLHSISVTTGSHFDFSGAVLSQGANLTLIGLDATQLREGTKAPRFGAAIDSISFKGSTISGSLLLSSVNVDCGSPNSHESSATTALNLESISLGGDFRITRHTNCDRSYVKGQINLRGASVGGRVRFEGLKVIAKASNRIDVPPPAAIFCRLARIGGDFILRPSPDLDHEPASPRQTPAAGRAPNQAASKSHRSSQAHPCVVIGQLDISAAEIGGDAHFLGLFDAMRRIRAIKAQRAHIKRNVRFGHVGKPGLHSACSVRGECDFAAALIDGYVHFSGSEHRLTMKVRGLDHLRYKQGQAVNLRDARIGRDLAFESSNERRCTVQGLSLIGAVLGGRLIVAGTRIVAVTSDGNLEKLSPRTAARSREVSS